MSNEKTTPELGKMKEEFEAWYLTNFENDIKWCTPMRWRGLPFIFQSGVYLEFFREKGIDIFIIAIGDQDYGWIIRCLKIGHTLDRHDWGGRYGRFNAHHRALIEAIEAAARLSEAPTG